jgi:hypothetical protein
MKNISKVFLLLFFSSSVFSQTHTYNEEFQVNTYTTLDQIKPRLTSLSKGGFVVVWQSWSQDSSSYGIYAQIYDNDGLKTGTEFRVNSYTTGYQLDPSVSGLINGNFVICWSSEDQDGSGYGIYCQIFDPSGIKIGNEFRANTYTLNNQTISDICGLNNGRFVICWQSRDQDGSWDGIYAQIYKENGEIFGNEFRVNTYQVNNQEDAAISSSTNGNFLISWTSDNQGEDEHGIFAQIFNGDGQKIGSELHVNTYSTNNQIHSDNCQLNNGNFIICWQTDDLDGSGYGIYGQLFDSTGIKISEEFQINSYTNSNQVFSNVSRLLHGGFVVCWESYMQDGDRDGIFAQSFDSSGVKVGQEFMVNSYTHEYQQHPSVSNLTNGDFVICWDSYGQDGSAGGIFGKLFPEVVTTVNDNLLFSSFFSLFQNYPNPFNPTTKIKFTIPANVGTSRDLSLRIYDALGNEITTLVNEHKPPGTYEVEFSANDFSLTSGIYFYKLTVGQFSDTRKMLLIK